MADRPRPDPNRRPKPYRAPGAGGRPGQGRPRGPAGSGGPSGRGFPAGPGGASGPGGQRRGFGFRQPGDDTPEARGSDGPRDRPWSSRDRPDHGSGGSFERPAGRDFGRGQGSGGPGRGRPAGPGGPGSWDRSHHGGPRSGGFSGPSGRSAGRPPEGRPEDRGQPDRPFDDRRPGPRPPFRGSPAGPRSSPSGAPRPRSFGPPAGRGGFERPRPDRPVRDRAPFERPAFDRPRPERNPFDRPGPDRPWRDAGSRPAPPVRPSLPQPDLLADDEELVAGRRPVEEAFVARRPAHRLLVVPQRRQALERLVLHATSLRIPVVEVEGGTLTALAGFDGHQGIALAVEPRTYVGIDDILARSVERGEPPFVLVLDSLEDPQNVGTLLRSAEAAGIHGVIFPTHHQAPLTPAAIKASAGAVEHLLLCAVDDLPGAMSDLRIRGLRIAAAEAEAPLTAAQADLRGPLAIVVGSEGQGLSPAIRRRSDVSVRIPMRGAIGSLNAAVAGSILLFAAVSQRDPGGVGDKPARAIDDGVTLRDLEPLSGARAPRDEGESEPRTPARAGRAKGLSVQPDDGAAEAVTAALPPDETQSTGTGPAPRRRVAKTKTAMAPTPTKPPRKRAAARVTAASDDDSSAPVESAASRPRAGRKTATAATQVGSTARAGPVRRRGAASAAAGPAGGDPAPTDAKPARRRAASPRAKPAAAPVEDASAGPEALLPGGPDPS